MAMRKNATISGCSPDGTADTRARHTPSLPYKIPAAETRNENLLDSHGALARLDELRPEGACPAAPACGFSRGRHRDLNATRHLSLDGACPRQRICHLGHHRRRGRQRRKCPPREALADYVPGSPLPGAPAAGRADSCGGAGGTDHGTTRTAAGEPNPSDDGAHSGGASRAGENGHVIISL